FRLPYTVYGSKKEMMIMIKSGFYVLFAGLLAVLSSCGGGKPGELPAPAPDPADVFGVDLNINMETIDSWLGREDVAYRDMRMLFDPADFTAIGGSSVLSATLPGFRIVPYPYLATLPPLPVSGAYEGPALYSLTWNAAGEITDAAPNYAESAMVLADLFPRDKAVFLMCGGGGYAGLTRALLIHLGWDADKLYNIGGNWGYKGDKGLELVGTSSDGGSVYATWRADYAFMDFARMTPKKQ
ncbi:MAG: hypothetical protein JXB03_04180, partial [Spirochaetales bacterium]|nr:hypothetical protein [Spirochaetales bacterium]